MSRKRTTLAAVALAGAALGATAGPAAAQYPGANGEQVVESDSGPDYYCGNDSSPSQVVYYPGFTKQGGGYSPNGKVFAQTVSTGDIDTPSSWGTLVIGLGGGPAACPDLHFIPGADPQSHLSFSPDGRSIAIERKNDVQVISATTGKLVRNLTPALPTGTYALDPTWDPKNRAVAYVATDGIRTRPPGGGAGKLLVKGAGLSNPDYSPDGRYLGYVDATGHIAYADAVTGVLVKRTPVAAVDFRWSPDGTSFLFTKPDAGINDEVPSCPVATLSGLITSRVTTDTWCNVIAWQPLP